MDDLFKINQKKILTTTQKFDCITNKICLRVNSEYVNSTLYQSYLNWINNYPDYNIYIVTDSDLEEYVSAEFNQTISFLFKKLTKSCQNQLFNILWIYLNGGWILNLAYIPLKKLRSYQLHLVLAKNCYQNNSISEKFIAAKSQHPFLGKNPSPCQSKSYVYS